jgi:hypothetical protein
MGQNREESHASQSGQYIGTWCGTLEGGAEH